MLAKNQGTSTQTVGVLSYPKAHRMSQIEHELAIHQTMSRKPMTMRQIARRLNMAASGHLMTILWDMCDQGRIIGTPRPYRNMTAWDWKLAPNRMGAALDKVYG